jgi:NADH-quinone oxidoreductase subunit C
MSEYYHNLAARVRQYFGDQLSACHVELGELAITVPRQSLIDVCTALRDEPEFACEQLMDLCGVDYLEYGEGAWQGERFAVAYQLLSVTNNHRIRVKAFTDGEPPMIDSMIGVWASANWFEREAFDLFGIVFEGHPDLRRILTDYGFIGHPFRKDFPLIGNVEMRYDPEKRRVIYEPVSIVARVNQPRVIRDDHRYVERLGERDQYDA